MLFAKKTFNTKIYNWAFLGMAVAGLSACGGYSKSDKNYDDTPDTPSMGTSQKLAPNSTFNSTIGTVYTSNKDNLTLYTFENDRTDKDGDGIGDSDCNNDCAVIWPPLEAKSDSVTTGDFSIITRDDGSTLQWAHKGLPLYMFHSDLQQGDLMGEAIKNVWFVARPDPFKVTNSNIGSILTGSTLSPQVAGDGSKGTTRTDKQNFSLYVFDKDKNNADNDDANDSDCNGNCAVIWPPLYADKGATASGQFSIINRDDQTQQWAFKNEPLYFFQNDTQAGDTNGDKVKTVWHIARTAPVQLFEHSNLGNVFSARGEIAQVTSAGEKSTALSERTGFALYTFDNDTENKSNCNANCAVIWPPLYAENTDIISGDFSIITRDDNSKQWAYKTKPLYFYLNDNVAGEVNGIDIPKWHEVKP